MTRMISLSMYDVRYVLNSPHPDVSSHRNKKNHRSIPISTNEPRRQKKCAKIQPRQLLIFPCDYDSIITSPILFSTAENK